MNTANTYTHGRPRAGQLNQDKTMLIQIAYSETPEAVARVRQMLDATTLHDIDFNGEEFVIERDEYTCIPGRDDEDANTLFTAICARLRCDFESPKAGFGLTAMGTLYPLARAADDLDEDIPY